MAPTCARALGDDIPEERLVAAVRAEMGYYKEHSHEGRDPSRWRELRARSAAVLSEALGRPVEVETLMEAIRFRAFPDAVPALAALGARGLTRVCVSNWDCALPEVLERTGLAPLVDGVVTSASAGARKPDPGDLRPGARARRMRSRARRCTSATPPMRTSRRRARPGSGCC